MGLCGPLADREDERQAIANSCAVKLEAERNETEDQR